MAKVIESFDWYTWDSKDNEGVRDFAVLYKKTPTHNYGIWTRGNRVANLWQNLIVRVL